MCPTSPKAVLVPSSTHTGAKSKKGTRIGPVMSLIRFNRLRSCFYASPIHCDNAGANRLLASPIIVSWQRRGLRAKSSASRTRLRCPLVASLGAGRAEPVARSKFVANLPEEFLSPFNVRLAFDALGSQSVNDARNATTLFSFRNEHLHSTDLMKWVCPTMKLTNSDSAIATTVSLVSIAVASSSQRGHGGQIRKDASRLLALSNCPRRLAPTQGLAIQHFGQRGVGWRRSWPVCNYGFRGIERVPPTMVFSGSGLNVHDSNSRARSNRCPHNAA